MNIFRRKKLVYIQINKNLKKLYKNICKLILVKLFKKKKKMSLFVEELMQTNPYFFSKNLFWVNLCK